MSDAIDTTAPPAPATAGALLAVVGARRSFGETRALDGADIAVEPGEIHALAGENGSGKSTLIKLLSGVLRPGDGEVRWNGEAVRFSTPAAAQRAGISTVFQETFVAPELSVRENIFLGTDGTFRAAHSRDDEVRIASEALTALGIGTLGVERPVWTLSLAERQLVTIARAVVRPWRLLILDEATSALDEHQRERLFAFLRGSRAEGRSVIFTSHRMDEFVSLADHVTVLRLGKSVAQMAIGDSTPTGILRHMAGSDRPEAPAALVERAARAQTDEPVLRTVGLRLHAGAAPSSIEIRPGEIFGLAGLEGQGQADFAGALCGRYKPAGGTVEVRAGDGWERIASFRKASSSGVAYVPRERKTEGLFFSLSIVENFALPVLPIANRLGLVRRREIKQQFDRYAGMLRLKYGRPGDLIGTLSGGNQQKVLLGRWLATSPRVLILNDPLRGVDANTKNELYGVFRELAAEGLAIVLLSTEIAELLTLCDRVGVFHEGAIEAVLDSADADETAIVSAMFGHREGVRA